MGGNLGMDSDLRINGNDQRIGRTWMGMVKGRDEGDPGVWEELLLQGE